MFLLVRGPYIEAAYPGGASFGGDGVHPSGKRHVISVRDDQWVRPSASVLLPVYNGGEYLVPAIESILSQTFRDFELLLSNDGGSDNSLQVLDGHRSYSHSVFQGF